MATPIRSILAATDLTPASNEAVRAAASLSALTGAELHVLHAQEPARAPGAEGVLSMQRRIHDARVALGAALQEALPEQARVASAQVALERAPAAILERAREVGADLIVIGPHLPRAFGDQVLGTTADQLVRESAIPCLIVRAPLPAPLSRIVVPSDLSDAARGALSVALRWSGALRGSPSPDGGELTVVHVDSDPGTGESSVAKRYERWIRLERQTAAALERAGKNGALRVRREILHGSSPAEEILRFARESGTDLLVMSTRGDRPLVKALLGSVSAAVTRTSEIPLLLIPPAMWSAEGEEGAAVEAVSAASALPPLGG